MNLPLVNFANKKTLYVVYIIAIKKNSDDTINKVKYLYNSPEKGLISKVIDAKILAKYIFNDSWIAWCGTFNSKMSILENVSKVTVEVKNGEMYLTSISDDYVANNLLKLEEFE